MKISLNTVGLFTAVNFSIDELLAKINGQLGSVEEAIDLGGRYEEKN